MGPITRLSLPGERFASSIKRTLYSKGMSIRILSNEYRLMKMKKRKLPNGNKFQIRSSKLRSLFLGALQKK